MYSLTLFYGICHLILAIACVTLRVCGKSFIPSREKKYIRVIEIIPYLILSCHMVYKVFTLEHEYCDFHHVCYGGVENMHYHSISYDSYTGCLDSTSIGDVINKYYEIHEDDSIYCEETEYGCCHIENKCQTSYEFNMNFTEYQKYYILKDNGIHGVINTMIKKNNPNGDNCLSHIDYINFYEDQQIHNVLFIYCLAFDGYILFYTVLFICDCCKDKHEFERVEQAPFDHTREKGSV